MFGAFTRSPKAGLLNLNAGEKWERVLGEFGI
jgi:hypothetical protein